MIGIYIPKRLSFYISIKYRYNINIYKIYKLSSNFLKKLTLITNYSEIIIIKENFFINFF